MATMNITGAVDMGATADVNFDFALGDGVDFFTWQTDADFVVTFHSALDDMTTFFEETRGTMPLTGTVNSVVSVTDLGNINYTATGLNFDIISVINTISLGSVAVHEAYWESILSGTTRFNIGNAGEFNGTGDFINVSAGQTVSAGADRFLMPNTGNTFTIIAGDSFNVAAGGTLTGGADVFLIENVALVGPKIVGDAKQHTGTVNGGLDTITVNGLTTIDMNVSGDVDFSDGLLNGGNDRINIIGSQDFEIGFANVAGDAGTAVRTVNGGNDIIKLSGNGLFLLDMSGDVGRMEDATAVVDGGNDAITIEFAAASQVSGDVIFMSSGTLTAGNDTITVNSSITSRIFGDVASFVGGVLTPGSDILTGGSGDDVIFGETGEVTFPVTPGTTVNSGGNDTLNGREGNDVLMGQVGNDKLIGGAGDDTINGGSGTDTVDFSSLAEAVVVDLAGIAGTNDGDGLVEAMGQGLDQILLTENVIGSSQADTIKGDALGNVLTGLGGADVLNGREGNDFLQGGTGKDTLVGGTGNDRFIFAALNETTANANSADVIMDFGSTDHIDLRNIDANGASAGDQAFNFIAGPLTGTRQLTFGESGGNTIISGSTDADAAAEFVIVLRGVHSLNAGDFLL